MTQILNGKEVAASLEQQNRNLVESLTAKGITPTLAVVRVGARPDDVYYEKAILRGCEKIGLNCQVLELPPDVNQEKLTDTVRAASADKNIHGIFFFSPLPKHLDEAAARALIPVDKDVDCLTLGSAAKVFTDDATGFPPCTPQGVMEILHHYNYELKGKNVVVVGRSMVVGKPLAMLLLKEHATVTICHSRTVDLPKVCQGADILIGAVGRAKMINQDYVHPGQIVIDVGINEDPADANKICGDVDYEAVSPIVQAITPVPGGVGSVTTQVLFKHTLAAAQQQGR